MIYAAARFVLCVSLVFLQVACSAGRLADKTETIHTPGDHQFTLELGGFQRHYSVYVPPGIEPDESLPVVLMLHGGGGKSHFAARETAWKEKASQERFLAVFPDALPPNPDRRSSFATNPQLWNDGSDRFYQGQAVVDDVAFLGAMLDKLIKDYGIDSARVYVTGFSNGASMSFLLAASMSQRITAIAPVAGASWVAPNTNISAVSVLYITGTEDPLNPIEGGDLELATGGKDIVRSRPKPPVRESINQWVSALGCKQTPSQRSDPQGVITETYPGCRQGSEVRYVRIEGLGHHWPGGNKMLPEGLVGKWSDRVNATDMIWTFFSRQQFDP